MAVNTELTIKYGADAITVIELGNHKYIGKIAFKDGKHAYIANKHTHDPIEYDTQGEVIYAAIQKMREHRGEIIYLS
jgi:hypothetical protein